ncbi:MAG: hypothetical protein II213_04595, partial [Lachnospiraceae bacterium]|nr:hypothetical protein [Lachnospiraceae bacterium]
MKKREWLSLVMLACTVMPALLISYNKIFRTGIDGERFLRSETQWLLLEVTILFGAAFAILTVTRNQKIRMGALALEAAAFTWIHQAFLPMVVSGLYLMVIICIGSVVRRWLDRDSWFEEWEWPTKMADFTLGSIGLILLYGLMSLIGIGSIPATRAAAAGLGIAAGYMSLRRSKKATVFENTKISWPAAMAIAFVIAMLLLQVGRMNICADYDSLHYGLRSEYVFNDGDGIFENMGSINVVYTYSKGLETLLLPISGLPSYSFFLSFQVWMTLGILMAATEIAGMFVERNWKLLCMVFLVSIPAITNMGITAKTDSATCLFQLIMTYFLLRFVKERKT